VTSGGPADENASSLPSSSGNSGGARNGKKPQETASVHSQNASGDEDAEQDVLPRLQPENYISEFPEDAQAVLAKVAEDLELAYAKEVPETAKGIFSVSQASADDSRAPALAFSPDIDDMWNKSDISIAASHAVRSYSAVLRTTEEDFKRFLRIPSMDADVQSRLPTAGKSAPGYYSPFWEEELKSVDARSRALMRLSSFGTTIAEHHGRVLHRDFGVDSDIFREAKLLSALVVRSLESSMALARCVCTLRRVNACASLKSTHGSDLSDLMKRPKGETHQFLFGDTFCEQMDLVSDRRAKEKDLKMLRPRLNLSRTRRTRSQSQKQRLRLQALRLRLRV
jgi:hypothetical protein